MTQNNTPPKWRVRYEDGSGYLELPQELDFGKQIFSHKDDSGVQRHYNTVRLYEIAKAYGFPIHNVKIDPSQAAWLKERAGVDLQHIKNMTAKRTLEPGLLLRWDNNEGHLIIDGNHRYLKRFSMGRPTMRFYIFTEEQARAGKLVMSDRVGSSLLRSFT